MVATRPTKWSKSPHIGGQYEPLSHLERAPKRTSYFPSTRYVRVVLMSDRPANLAITGLFEELVSQWRPRSLVTSSIHQVVLTPAYQSMIGLGRPALPLLLDRLRTEGGPHWFWALRSIARVDPAANTDTVEEARAQWLDWAKETGLLD